MIGVVFGVAFGLCGLFALALAWKLIGKKRAIEKWPKANGRIASLHVETRDQRLKDSHGFYYRAKVPLRVVKYSYDVNGRQHEGEIYESVIKGTRNTPVVSAYSSGQEVQIFYDPTDPKRAYLELPRKSGEIVIAVMGAVFVVIGIASAALLHDAF